MKKKFHSVFLIAAFIGFAAFTNDVLQQLSLAEEDAKEAIKDNFINGGLYFPDNQTIKTIAVAKRSTTVGALGDYMKQYIYSPEFAEAYEEAKQDAKPAGKADTKALIENRLQQIEEELPHAEENLKNAAPAMKKLNQLSVDQLKQEREALKNTKHPMHNDYVSNLKDEEEENAGQQEMEAKFFDEKYPATVKELVKKRLREFLAFTADINFNAQLVQQGKFKVFADAALESKDANWKKCFRAGPETIGAARKYAQQWLVQLESTKGF